VRTVRSVLRQALQQALKWSLLMRNVASLVDVPRITHEPPQPYSIEEARSFLESIRGDRNEALIVTAIMTGMRRGEVLALRWDDVDFKARTLRVSSTLQRVGGALVRAEPKTQHSRRIIAVPPQVMVALDMLATQRKRQLEDGTPIDPRNLTRIFAGMIARAGLRPQRFHDLRHCFASLQLASGVPARVVMEQLGHTQISTTLDIYSHVTQSLHRESADRLGELFAG
jgi:integrase